MMAKKKKPSIIYTHVWRDELEFEIDPKRGLVVWRTLDPLKRIVLHLKDDRKKEQ